MILVWWVGVSLSFLVFLIIWAITPGGLWKKVEFPQKYQRTDHASYVSHPGESQRLRTYLYGGQYIPGYSLPANQLSF